MTAVTIRHLFFRFEGVVTQSVHSALLSEAAERGRTVDPTGRQILRDLGSKMHAGSLGWAEYCSKAAELTGSPGDGDLIGGRLLDRLAIEQEIKELLAETARHFDVWLFCEIPEEVLAPTVHRLGVDVSFPRNRLLFLSESCRADRPDALVPCLLEKTGARLAELLWIDDRPSIDSAAIRFGLNAVAYVDPFRLRRNLVLRGLLQ